MFFGRDKKPVISGLLNFLKCSNSDTFPISGYDIPMFQVHVLRWSTVCDGSAPLWPHPGRHGEGHCHEMGSSEWIPRRQEIWLGLPRSSCCKCCIFCCCLHTHTHARMHACTVTHIHTHVHSYACTHRLPASHACTHDICMYCYSK